MVGQMLHLLSSVGVDGIPAEIVSEHNQIITMLGGLLAAAIGALAVALKNLTVAKSAAKDAQAASRAVNHIGPDDERLYDIIQDMRQRQAAFDIRWGNLPPDMDDAVGLAEMLHDINRRLSLVEAHIAKPDTNRQP